MFVFGLFSECGHQLVLQVHLFSLHFIQETFAQAYSKWCISGGPHRWVLPPHLYRVCLYFPRQWFAKLFYSKSLAQRIYFVIFLSLPAFGCWMFMLTMHGGASWMKKKGFRKLYHLCPVHPNPYTSVVFKAALVLHSTASKNQTELKLSVHKAGKCRSFAGFLSQVMEFRSACSVDETVVGFRMDGNKCKDFPPFMCLLCDHIAFL